MASFPHLNPANAYDSQTTWSETALVQGNDSSGQGARTRAASGITSTALNPLTSWLAVWSGIEGGDLEETQISLFGDGQPAPPSQSSKEQMEDGHDGHSGRRRIGKTSPNHAPQTATRKSVDELPGSDPGAEDTADDESFVAIAVPLAAAVPVALPAANLSALLAPLSVPPIDVPAEDPLQPANSLPQETLIPSSKVAEATIEGQHEMADVRPFVSTGGAEEAGGESKAPDENLSQEELKATGTLLPAGNRLLPLGSAPLAGAPSALNPRPILAQTPAHSTGQTVEPTTSPETLARHKLETRPTPEESGVRVMPVPVQRETPGTRAFALQLSLTADSKVSEGQLSHPTVEAFAEHTDTPSKLLDIGLQPLADEKGGPRDGSRQPVFARDPAPSQPTVQTTDNHSPGGDEHPPDDPPTHTPHESVSTRLETHPADPRELALHSADGAREQHATVVPAAPAPPVRHSEVRPGTNGEPLTADSLATAAIPAEPKAIRPPEREVRHMEVQVGDSADMRLRVRETGGRVEVSVHANDPIERQRLQTNLTELVQSLEKKGFHTEPIAGGGSLDHERSGSHSHGREEQSPQNQDNHRERERQDSPWQDRRQPFSRRGREGDRWNRIWEEGHADQRY